MTNIFVVENILIIAAEGFWLASNYSQLRRLVKTRNTRGLSAPNQTLNAAGNIAWATYFTSQRLWVPTATNLTMMLITAVTLAYTLGNKKQFSKGVVAILTVGPLTSYLLISFPEISGWIGVAFNTIAATPQIIHIVRTKKTSGISERGLFFGFGAMACTLTYALLISSVPLTVGVVVGLSLLSTTATLYYRYKHN